MANGPVSVAGTTVAPGQSAIVYLPVAELYTHTELALPVHIVNGKKPGPTLFLTAAVHGDELNGVDIIRRVLKLAEIKQLSGCLLAVPIVNVFGFINRSRYLPDRRDLNRSFPGREKGSVAARLAHLVAREILSKADYGIDLHTAAIDRTNLPHIRADLDHPKVLEMANAFGTPVIINANVVDGSLRAFTAQRNIPILVYEAGEALRFDEVAIRAGVQGVRRVMRALEMLPPRPRRNAVIEPVVSTSTTWVRAPGSGIVHHRCRLGDRIKVGDTLATIGDPFGERQFDVAAGIAGIVIGHSTLPLAHEGDALFHVAQFDNTRQAKATVEEFQQAHNSY